MTQVKVYFLPREKFLAILSRFRKIRYFVKRWVAWELVRRFIFAYAKLYRLACLRGALLEPPLLSRRGIDLGEEEMDEVDLAVLEHIEDAGY
jgi:hypothetical protein